MIMLKALWDKVWGYVVLAGAVLAGLFALRQSGKSAGKAEAQKKQQEAAAKDRGKAREVDDEIDSMADADIRARARDKWLRDSADK